MDHPTDHKRRAVLAGLAGAVSGVPARLGARQAETLDLGNPNSAMRLYARIVGAADGRPALWHSQSIYYGQPDDDAPRPILGSEGLDLVRLEFDGPQRLIETTERVSFYTDLETEEIVTQWRNVFTGETIPLQKPLITTRAVIEKNQMRSSERSSYVDIDRTGLLRQPFLQGDVLTIPQEQFATFNTSALQDAAGRRPGQRWWSGIWISFSAAVADLADPDGDVVAGHGLLFGAAPWYSWLRMGERKGTSSVRRYSTKVRAVGELPGRLADWVSEHYPALIADRRSA